MRKSSKFLALVLSVLMMVSVFSFSADAAFTDVSASDEALSEAVSLLANLGITTGTSETTFGTNEAVTRQQMATFIYRLMKKGKAADTNAANTTSFTDLVDPFYNYTISWASDLGIIKGTSTTTFNPTGKIKLQDAYVMLVRALGYEKDEELVYPFGYIEKAEKIGLDDNIPAKVTYDTTLTRGNVAILLHNAFYADMATYEIGYEPTGYDVYGSDGKNYPNGENMPEDVEIVAADIAGQREYKKYDTVAEKIYEVTKTVQRIVATPNYKLDEDEYGIERELTRETGEGFVQFDVVKTNKDHKDDQPLGMVAFEKLGLEGDPDDYFLADCVVYVKDDEVLAAESLLTKKEGIQYGQIKFERSTGSGMKNFYPSNKDDTIVKDGRQTDARYRVFTGKVTIDGTTGYFFDAPWSYAKTSNFADKDSMNIRLLYLGADEDADPEDDEDYVPAFNFEADKDSFGRGDSDFYATSGFERMNPAKDGDTQAFGLYSTWGIYTVFGRENIRFEFDVWDSDSDGRIDYAWYKPYAVGFLNTEEDTYTVDMHHADDEYASCSSVLNEDGEPTIYTYGAVIEGAKPVDGRFAAAYVNGPANYIKIAQLADEDALQEHTVTKLYSDPNPIQLNGGSKLWRWGSSMKFMGWMKDTGSQFGLSYYKLSGSWKFGSETNYSSLALGDVVEAIMFDGSLAYISGASRALTARTDYVFMVPNKGDFTTYTDEIAPTVIDGIMSETFHWLQIYEDGEIRDVYVDPVTKAVIGETTIDGDEVTWVKTPATPKARSTSGNAVVYDYSDYIGKLLIPVTDAEGLYKFEVAPVELFDNIDVLSDDEPNAFYAYDGYDDGVETAAFVKSSGTNYKFVKKGTYDVKDSIAPSQLVNITEATRIVIRGVDDDDEYVYTEYSLDDLPDFGNTDMLKNIIYVVKNNPNSSRVEDLVFMYAELVDEAEGSFSKVLDLRVVKETYSNRDEEGETVVYYDVLDPFTGEEEFGYESYNNDVDEVAEVGAITLLSGGKIADHIDAGSLSEEGDMCTSDVKVADVKAGDVRFGYAVLDEYDTDSGLIYLEGSDMEYLLTDKTIVTYVDLTKDEPTISLLEGTSALESKSDKYRNGADEEIRVFISSEEVKKEDYEKVVVIVIVKNEKVPN